MSDFSQARDLVAVMLIVGAMVALILGLSPIQPWFLAAAALMLLGSGFIAKHRVLAVVVAVGVLGVRFLFVFALGRDWRMLLGALVCGGLVFCATKMDPSLLESAED